MSPAGATSVTTARKSATLPAGKGHYCGSGNRGSISSDSRSRKDSAGTPEPAKTEVKPPTPKAASKPATSPAAPAAARPATSPSVGERLHQQKAGEMATADAPKRQRKPKKHYDETLTETITKPKTGKTKPMDFKIVPFEGASAFSVNSNERSAPNRATVTEKSPKPRLPASPGVTTKPGLTYAPESPPFTANQSLQKPPGVSSYEPAASYQKSHNSTPSSQLRKNPEVPKSASLPPFQKRGTSQDRKISPASVPPRSARAISPTTSLATTTTDHLAATPSPLGQTPAKAFQFIDLTSSSRPSLLPTEMGPPRSEYSSIEVPFLVQNGLDSEFYEQLLAIEPTNVNEAGADLVDKLEKTLEYLYMLVREYENKYQKFVDKTTLQELPFKHAPVPDAKFKMEGPYWAVELLRQFEPYFTVLRKISSLHERFMFLTQHVAARDDRDIYQFSTWRSLKKCRFAGKPILAQFPRMLDDILEQFADHEFAGLRFLRINYHETERATVPRNTETDDSRSITTVNIDPSIAHRRNDAKPAASENIFASTDPPRMSPASMKEGALQQKSDSSPNEHQPSRSGEMTDLVPEVSNSEAPVSVEYPAETSATEIGYESPLQKLNPELTRECAPGGPATPPAETTTNLKKTSPLVEHPKSHVQSSAAKATSDIPRRETPESPIQSPLPQDTSSNPPVPKADVPPSPAPCLGKRKRKSNAPVLQTIDMESFRKRWREGAQSNDRAWEEPAAVYPLPPRKRCFDGAGNDPLLERIVQLQEKEATVVRQLVDLERERVESNAKFEKRRREMLAKLGDTSRDQSLIAHEWGEYGQLCRQQKASDAAFWRQIDGIERTAVIDAEERDELVARLNRRLQTRAEGSPAVLTPPESERVPDCGVSDSTSLDRDSVPAERARTHTAESGVKKRVGSKLMRFMLLGWEHSPPTAENSETVNAPSAKRRKKRKRNW